MAKNYLETYKTALITGATRGIGYEFARLLGSSSKELILVARDKERLLEMQNKFQSEFKVKVSVFSCDLSKPEDVNKLLGAIGGDLPSIDLLINNAGIACYGNFSDIEIDKQEELVGLNVTALMKLTHKVLPAMKRNKKGAILNVSSTSGFMSLPFCAVYSATKAFVINFSQALAREVHEDNIIVTCLCPGMTDTDFWKCSNMECLKERHKNLDDPKEVAEYGLWLIDNGKQIGMPSFSLKVKHVIRRCLPDKLISYYMYHHLKPKNERCKR